MDAVIRGILARQVALASLLDRPVCGAVAPAGSPLLPVRIDAATLGGIGNDLDVEMLLTLMLPDQHMFAVVRFDVLKVPGNRLSGP